MKRDTFDAIIRYLILLIVAIPNLYLFYLIISPITIYAVYFILDLFYQVSLSGNILFVNSLSIELINSCIAGSAYYLLLIFNLSIPKIKIKERLIMIFFSFSLLYLINVFRIIFLTILALSNYSFFDITHKIFWYSLSILFVVGIWFLEVKLFKIKSIPFYSDVSYIYKKSLFNKKYAGLALKLKQTAEESQLQIFIKEKSVKDIFVNVASRLDGLSAIGASDFGKARVEEGDKFSKELSKVKNKIFIYNELTMINF